MLQISILVLVIILLYYYFWKPLTYWKNLNVPYSTPVPIIGSFFKVVLNKVSLAENLMLLYQEKPNTSIIGLFQLSSDPALLVRDPIIIKQIAINHFDYFGDHNDKVFMEKVDPFLGKMLFSLKGQRWRNMRSTLSPAFTGSKMRNMFDIIVECGVKLVNYCNEEIEKTNVETLELEFKDLFTRFTNDAIATTAFGFKCDSFRDRDNVFFKMGQIATEFRPWKIALIHGAPALMKLLNFHLIPEKIINYFSALIIDNLKKRDEEGIYRPDMLNLLLQARKGKLDHCCSQNDFDKSNESSSKHEEILFTNIEEPLLGKSNPITLSDEDVSAQAFNFFLAGFETISTGLSFAVYEIALNPDIQKRLQKELDVVQGKITYEKINDIKYLNMVVLETLRKWPPLVVTDRVCTKPYTFEVDGRQLEINPGMPIIISIIGIHRDPKYYTNPEIYDPERFNSENKTKILPETYLPFGIGPRNCIGLFKDIKWFSGSRFALMELKVVLYFLFKNFEVTVTKKTPIPLILKKKSSNLTSRDGFWLGLRKRN